MAMKLYVLFHSNVHLVCNKTGSISIITPSAIAVHNMKFEKNRWRYYGTFLWKVNLKKSLYTCACVCEGSPSSIWGKFTATFVMVVVLAVILPLTQITISKIQWVESWTCAVRRSRRYISHSNFIFNFTPVRSFIASGSIAFLSASVDVSPDDSSPARTHSLSQSAAAELSWASGAARRAKNGNCVTPPSAVRLTGCHPRGLIAHVTSSQLYIGPHTRPSPRKLEIRWHEKRR